MADDNITLMDHQIAFLNFEGKERQFNVAGDRNFHVVLTPEEAEKYLADRWNVKFHEGREEGDPGWYSLQVKVGFGGYKPPVVVMITSKGQKILGESGVAVLDAVDLKRVDMVIRPYDHNSGMGTGRSAYLKTMYATIDEDPLMAMYGLNLGTATADGDGETPF